jgi:glyoxylase-like metal-dependent hydrolase (beta-lactamase superfamily II)
MRPLYHYLDPFWSRFPFPATHHFERSAFASIEVLRMTRVYFGREVLPVFCYVFDKTMVDTGISSVSPEIGEFAKSAKVERAFLTHHHEDHSGNAALLAREGVEVFASAEGVKLVKNRLPRRFYQHALWGEADPVAAGAAPEFVEFGRRRARVIPAFGHSPDQVAYLVPEEGWLFSGDAFVAEKIKVFRGDENFYDTVATMRHFLELDFDALLCAHRPRFTGGKQAIRGKLEWLLELEGIVKECHQKGHSVRTIVRSLGLETSTWLYKMTFGDASTANLVRSILTGPRPRVEVLEALKK